MTSVTVRSTERVEVIDVTDLVLTAISDVTGLVLVHLTHTTAALLVGAADLGARADLVKVATHLLAPQRPFVHVHDGEGTSTDGKMNGEAHLLSALLGSRVCISMENGRPSLGTWQRLLLLELDGPQTRTVRVHVSAGIVETTP